MKGGVCMFFGAIEIGIGNITVAVCNEKGQIIKVKKTSSSGEDWLDHFATAGEALIECSKKLALDIHKDIGGIGIVVPITMEKSDNSIYATFKKREIAEVEKWFVEFFDLQEIRVEITGRACALGEMMFGGGGSDFLWVSLGGEGGGAIIANGDLVSGNNNCAGEFEHLKVEFETPKKCSCGQYGCLIAHISEGALQKEFEEMMIVDFAFSEYMINKLFLDDSLKIDAHGLSVLAKEGNPTAMNIFCKAGMYIGRAIAYGVNILNPKTVYIGGGISESMDLILPSMEMELNKCASAECGNVKICISELGLEAPIIGAAAVAIRKYEGQ